MTVLFVIFPLTLLFSSIFVVAYVWATRTGQLDDLDTPPLRVLHDGAPRPAREARPEPPRKACASAEDGARLSSRASLIPQKHR